jgi:hypothetical protein
MSTRWAPSGIALDELCNLFNRASRPLADGVKLNLVLIAMQGSSRCPRTSQSLKLRNQWVASRQTKTGGQSGQTNGNLQLLVITGRADDVCLVPQVTNRVFSHLGIDSGANSVGHQALSSFGPRVRSWPD